MVYVCSSAIQAEVVKLYNQGYSSKDICSACDLSVSNVRKILKEAGFNTRGYRKASDCVKDKVLLLIKNGYPYNKIEQLLHVSTHLVREIVLHNGMTGYAPKFHHPIKLEVDEADISDCTLAELRKLYLSGEYGLAECSEMSGASDPEFLWFVYHLTENDKQCHREKVRKNVEKMYSSNVPVMAIAKSMNISPAIVKKMLKELG